MNSFNGTSWWSAVANICSSDISTLSPSFCSSLSFSFFCPNFLWTFIDSELSCSGWSVSNLIVSPLSSNKLVDVWIVWSMTTSFSGTSCRLAIANACSPDMSTLSPSVCSSPSFSLSTSDWSVINVIFFPFLWNNLVAVWIVWSMTTSFSGTSCWFTVANVCSSGISTLSPSVCSSPSFSFFCPSCLRTFIDSELSFSDWSVSDLIVIPLSSNTLVAVWIVWSMNSFNGTSWWSAVANICSSDISTLSPSFCSSLSFSFFCPNFLWTFIDSELSCSGWSVSNLIVSPLSSNKLVDVWIVWSMTTSFSGTSCRLAIATFRSTDRTQSLSLSACSSPSFSFFCPDFLWTLVDSKSDWSVSNVIVSPLSAADRDSLSKLILSPL